MITVFTPTYNRGYIIDKLYHSLQRQTDFNFEWIVIDDESTDNTSELFAKWVNEPNKFPIIYKKQKRGGKHRAQNKALNMAKGEAFFCVDSDDYLVDNAIELSGTWFDNIKQRDDICGVCGLRGLDENTVLGRGGVSISGKYIDFIHYTKLLKRYGFLRDLACIYKTDILKKCMMPEFENELYAPESLFTMKMVFDGYKTRYYNRIIYIGNYLPDGLTKTGVGWQYRNPNAFVAYLDICEKCGDMDHLTAENRKRGLYFGLVSGYGSKYANTKLNVPFELQKNYKAQYNDFVDEMKKFLTEKNIKEVVIYGLGAVGELFIHFFKVLSIPIKFGIDKTVRNKLGIVGVAPQEAKLDSNDETMVIVTLVDYNDEVTEYLTNCGCRFAYWKDISCKYWDIIKPAL